MGMWSHGLYKDEENAKGDDHIVYMRVCVYIIYTLGLLICVCWGMLILCEQMCCVDLWVV